MTIGYFDDAGDIYAEGLNCPECGSISTLRNVEFGDWKCEDCSTVWNESDKPETPDLCEVCGGTGVDGYEGDPDSGLPGEWNDLPCKACGGSGYV